MRGREREREEERTRVGGGLGDLLRGAAAEIVGLELTVGARSNRWPFSFIIHLVKVKVVGSTVEFQSSQPGGISALLGFWVP